MKAKRQRVESARRSPYFASSPCTSGKSRGRKIRNKKQSPVLTPSTPTNADEYLDAVVSGPVTSNAKTVASDKKHESSPHFLQAPSSVVGSLASLGPTFFTWTELSPPSLCTWSYRRDANPTNACSDPSKSPTICEFCTVIVQDSIRHFKQCNIFQERYDRTLQGFNQTRRLQRNRNIVAIQEQDNDDKHHHTMCQTCLDVAAQAAEASVRHLCSHGCYLKAFAPCRDWIQLRKTLHDETDMPLGTYESS